MANNDKRFRMHPLFKRGMAFIMVIAPFWWLVMTDDGQRRNDLVMNALFGDGEPMNLSFSKLTADARREDFEANWPELALQCTDSSSKYGDRVCIAAITEINGTPAHHVHLYLQSQRINAVQLLYVREHHQYMLTRLYDELGPAKDMNGVWQWITPWGLVVAPKTLTSDSDAEVWWISTGPSAVQ
jgi:hypothetical protein